MTSLEAECVHVKVEPFSVTCTGAGATLSALNCAPEMMEEANGEFAGNSFDASPLNGPSIRLMNAWLTPAPPADMNSVGVDGSARYFLPFTDT